MIVSRRSFLVQGLAAGAVLSAGLMRPSSSGAAWTRVNLDRCREMSPTSMAEASGDVMSAWSELLAAAQSIRNPSIRGRVLAILQNPAPSIAEGADQPAIIRELKAADLLPAQADPAVLFPPYAGTKDTPQPFYAAPGSGWGSHHAYPGGLATHTAFNVCCVEGLLDGYKRMFGFSMDRDVAVAAQLLHDLHKPWVFQWQKDGSCRAEQQLAGTGEHHVLSLAESLKRGLPAEVVVAQACAHTHPGTPNDEAAVVGWLRAACIIAGKNPIAENLLAGDGKTLPLPRRMEGFVTHLADHDFVLAVPAAQWLVPVLRSIAVKKYGMSEKDAQGAPFNAFRNLVCSQATMMHLYSVYSTQGEDGLYRQVALIVNS